MVKQKHLIVKLSENVQWTRHRCSVNVLVCGNNCLIKRKFTSTTIKVERKLSVASTVICSMLLRIEIEAEIREVTII